MSKFNEFTISNFFKISLIIRITQQLFVEKKFVYIGKLKIFVAQMADQINYLLFNNPLSEKIIKTTKVSCKIKFSFIKLHRNFKILHKLSECIF